MVALAGLMQRECRRQHHHIYPWLQMTLYLCSPPTAATNTYSASISLPRSSNSNTTSSIMQPSLDHKRSLADSELEEGKRSRRGDKKKRNRRPTEDPRSNNP